VNGSKYPREHGIHALDFPTMIVHASRVLSYGLETCLDLELSNRFLSRAAVQGRNVKPRDNVELAIERLGTLRNRYRAKAKKTKEVTSCQLYTGENSAEEHTQFKKPDGSFYPEKFGTEAFSGYTPPIHNNFQPDLAYQSSRIFLC